MIGNEARQKLIARYDVPGPRYTSYPTMPYWDPANFSTTDWAFRVKETWGKSSPGGISLYIHLPYCESLCTYCGCNTRITVNHAVEEPYIKAVLKEWEMYVTLLGAKPKIKELHLGGGTPTFFSPGNLRRLIEGILDSAEYGDQFEFGFEGHPANTTREHLQTLYELGFRRVSFGIQDFDPVVQEVINRHQTFQQVKYVTEAARQIGYTSVNFDLIYGLPLQTLFTIQDTIHKVIELNPDRIAFYSYAHVPWIKPGQRKFTELDLPKGEEKRMLYEEGRALFEKAGYLEIGMDHFAKRSDALTVALNQNKLHRNFMGYTTAQTRLMIGLGVSAISDSWNAFAQNKKVVEEYISSVSTGELPVFKGHLLTDEDLFIRKHILNLMCRYETSWIESDIKDAELFSQLMMQLKKLEADGLVRLHENSIVVCDEGKPFIRNICMAFDARLFLAKSGTQLFSSTI